MSDDPKEDDWLSIPQCAERWDVTRATIHNALKRVNLDSSDVRDIGKGRRIITVRGCDALPVYKDPKVSGKKRWDKKEGNE